MEQVTTTTTNAQATTTKAASKAKTAPKAKAAPKAASKAKAQDASLYAIAARPNAGNMLFDFTQALQEVLGMDKGKAVAKATLVKVAGPTAVRYHLGKGTYAEEGGKVTITAAGRAFFGTRAGRIDRKRVDQFKEVMTTGKPNDVCKNADLITQVG